MTAGHFALALGVKSSTPKAPLWALMLGSYLLDVVFIGFAGTGIEGFTNVRPGYGGALISAYYDHSFVGAMLIALLAGSVAWRVWGKHVGLVIGGVVLSHWFLDLVVHRPDLPILPGNIGGLPLLGFGLWEHPLVSAALEVLIVVIGIGLYARASSTLPSDGLHRTLGPGPTVGVAAALTIALLASDYFALPLLVGIVLMLALIIVCGWLDARLAWQRERTEKMVW